MSNDEPSFDPRSWFQTRPAAAPQDTAKTPPGSPPTVPPGTGFLRQNIVVIGISAAILSTGALTALITRPKVPVVTAPVVEAPVSPAAASGASTRTMTLSSLDQLVSALTASGLSTDESTGAARAARQALGNRPGEIRLELTLSGDSASHLTRAAVTYADSSGAVVTRDGSGSFTAAVLAAQLKTVVVVKRGEMDTNSFYSSAVTAGITDSLITPFANAFAYDFDFQREVKPGDVFEAVFEETQNAAGQTVGQPRLLYASLSTEQKSKAVYFFTPTAKDGGWFDGNGSSIIRSFLRTPIDGARITSQFGMRVHPVLGFEKMHKGTDFGAPVGTPIYAAGDGVVNWAAMKGPNGNLVIIQHDNGWQTYYLHMNAFGPGITAGVRVHQGQTIGYVGTTGRSTGPHLHYEMHIANEPVDAMTVPLAAGHALDGGEMTAFRTERDRIDGIRAQAQN